MSAPSPIDPSSKSSSQNRPSDSLFEETEHYFDSPFEGADSSAATSGHHQPGTTTSHKKEAAKKHGPETPGEHLNHQANVASAAPSGSAQSAAPRPSKARSGFWTLAALAVGIVAFWFLISELTTAASMQGSTVGNLIHLRAEVSGFVDEITTGEADEVTSGQTVARLSAEGIESQLERIEEVLALKRLEAEQVHSAIDEEIERLKLLHEISQRTEISLGLGIDELKIRLELATHLASELNRSVNRGSAKKFEFLEAESNRLRIAKQLEEQEAELSLQKLITANAAEGRHYHNGIVRSWLDELQLHAAKVATEIGQTEVEATTLRTTVAQSTVTTHREGRVFAIHHHAGSSVQPGDPIITLETDDRVWIIASFKYAEAEHIAYGDRAEINFPALDRSITGTVVAIGHNVISAVDADSPFLRLTPEEVLVKIEPDVAIDEVRSGISAKVRIRTHPFDLIGWVSNLFGSSNEAGDEPSEEPVNSQALEPDADLNDSEKVTAPPATEPTKTPTPKKLPPEALEPIPAPDADPGQEIPAPRNPFDFSQQ
jgi:multidrug resistance efflux pump